MADNLDDGNRMPPEYGPVDDTDHLPEGIYMVINKATRTHLEVAGGNPSPAAVCQSWRRLYDEAFLHARWVIRQDGTNGSYTLRNMTSGTFLDLSGGEPCNENKTTGCPRNPPEWEENRTRGNQEWQIKATADGYFTIQNVRSSTFLEFKNGTIGDGIPAVCSSFSEENQHQLWNIQRISRSGQEIISILGGWNEDLLSRLCQPYSTNTQYFVIPDEFRRNLWDQAGLRVQPLRAHVFDQDDFIIKAKEAVTAWARDKLRVDGYSVLFGLIYGQAKKGPNAYNWTLTPDMHSLLFFDAQSGTDCTAAALDARGFSPSFAVF